MVDAAPEAPSKLAESIDYNQEILVHGVSQFQTIQSNQFGSPIALSGGQVPVVFNLPTECMNFSESILSYNVFLPAAGALNYIWYHSDVVAEISHIQLYGTNNMLIADIDNFNNYSKVVRKYETAQEDYLTMDPDTRLYPSNQPNNLVPALRVDTTGAGLAVNSSQNYREPAYFEVSRNAAGAVTPNVDVSYQVRLPLKDVKDTILAMNKNFYFGQIVYMKIFFTQLNRIAFMSNQAANPNVAVVPYVPTAPNTAQIQNLQLFLAVETSPTERAACIARAAGGMSMMIPYVQAFKNSNNGVSQSIQLQIDTGSGRTLQKIFHSPFNNTETNNTAYDCDNRASLGAAFQKVQIYWTNLNSRRVQNNNLDCTSSATNAYSFTDYLQQKQTLKGSVMENRDVFQYNWCHKDDWTSFKNDYIFEGCHEYISGVPMGPVPITWNFFAQTTASLPLQHYTWCVFTKRLSIANGIINVD